MSGIHSWREPSSREPTSKTVGVADEVSPTFVQRTVAATTTFAAAVLAVVALAVDGSGSIADLLRALPAALVVMGGTTFLAHRHLSRNTALLVVTSAGLSVAAALHAVLA